MLVGKVYFRFWFIHFEIKRILKLDVKQDFRKISSCLLKLSDVGIGLFIFKKIIIGRKEFIYSALSFDFSLTLSLSLSVSFSLIIGLIMSLPVLFVRSRRSLGCLVC